MNRYRCSKLALAAGLACALLTTALSQKGGPKPPPPPPNPKIALSSGSTIYVMNEDGTNIRFVINSGSNHVQASMSPDGTKMAFAGTPGGRPLGLYVVNVDGTGLRLVTETDEQGYPDYCKWSPVPAPDGHYKLVYNDYPEDPTAMTYELMLVNVDGTGKTRLTYTDNLDEWECAWSPDATKLVVTYIFERDPANQYVNKCDVLTLGVSGEGDVVVTESASLVKGFGGPLENAFQILWPDWSRTSGKIALSVRGARGDWDVWVVDASSPSNAVNLTVTWNGANQRRPTWSPNDAKIAFEQSGTTKTAGIYTMNPDGSGRVQLTQGGAHPDWRRAP